MANINKGNTTTIKNIAEVQGCSTNTVSLALRNSPRISDAVRKDIHKIADKLGYIPNYAAQNLRNRKSCSIGIRVLDLYNTVRADFIGRILPRIRIDMNYRPVLGSGLSEFTSGGLEDCLWMRTFQEMAVEAIVLIETSVHKLPVWSRRTPFVYACCQPDEEAQCDYVGLDRHEVAILAVDHIRKRGHKEILLLDPKSNLTEYVGDYADSCGLGNITFNLFSRETDSIVKSYLDLQASGRPTAIFVGDTMKAIYLEQAFSAKGIKVPDDLAIVAYDYLNLNDSLQTPITTIEQPMPEIVDGIMNILKIRVSQPDHPFIKQVLHHKLVVRSSS